MNNRYLLRVNNQRRQNFKFNKPKNVCGFTNFH